MDENMRVRNQGMTLVELLVSIAAFAIAMIGIVSLINYSARFYSNSSKEVEIQSELNSVFTLVSNMIVDANSSVAFDSSHKLARIVHKDKKYVVQLVDHKLYAREYASPSAAESGIANPANLLAEHVDTFEIDASHYDDGYVAMKMKAVYGTREAYMSKNIFLRNTGSEKLGFEARCATEISTSGNNATFKITQNTGETIGSGTSLIIRVQVATAGVTDIGISDITSPTMVTVPSAYYNKVTGELTIHCVLTSGWSDSEAKQFTVNCHSAVSATGTQVLSISK